MCAYIYIKVYHVCPILHFFSHIISWKNSIISWFIVIIFFVFQSLLKDEVALKILIFFITSSYNSFSFFISTPALTITFPDNKLPNKLAPRVPNNILKKSSFLLFRNFSWSYSYWNYMPALTYFSDSFQQNIRIFKSLNYFHCVNHFFVWNY